MHIELLGELRVSVDGCPPSTPSRRVGALISMLALYANRSVPTSRLVSRLWGDDPPSTARATLKLNLTQIRSLTQQCGCPCRLVMTDLDCALHVPPEAVDLHVARRSSDEARRMWEAGRTLDAVSAFGRAHEMWRNFERSAFHNAPDPWPESRELREEHVVILEDYACAQLATGRPVDDALVVELRRLVDREPLRERPYLLLMESLAASGRFHQSLDVYEQAEGLLMSEWGIDPGAHLRHARQRVAETAWRRLCGEGAWHDGSDAAVLAVEHGAAPAAVDGASRLANWLDRRMAVLATSIETCGAVRAVVVHGSVSVICLSGADHAACAVRAALRVLDLSAEHASGSGRRAGVRAAVTAGPVCVLDDEAHEELEISGQAVDEAVRLLDAVPDGEVAVSGVVKGVVKGVGKGVTDGEALLRPSSAVVELHGATPPSLAQGALAGWS